MLDRERRFEQHHAANAHIEAALELLREGKLRGGGQRAENERRRRRLR
jgi:hypothetical protein